VRDAAPAIATFPPTGWLAAAARAVLSGRTRGIAKAGDGPVEMLRMFKLAKSSAVKARTQTINQPQSCARRGRPSPT
jgi:hypothetical protein